MLLNKSSIWPSRCGAATLALSLVAISALATAGIAAEPAPPGQAASRVAPPDSTPLPTGADPAAVRPPTPGRTLRDVVNAIEGTHGIRIWLDSAVPGTAPSDVDPTGLPAEIALRQAFQGYDLFLHFRPNPKTGALEVTRAWVYPRGRGDRLQVRAEPTGAAPGLESGDPAQVAVALPGLTVQPGTDPSEALLGALADPDESVRRQALIAAQANGLPLPAETIAGLVLNDPSEAVRMSAMDLLTMTSASEQGTARALLERVAKDPNPAIRDHAAALLGALNAQAGGAVPETGAVPEVSAVIRDLEAGDESVRQQALVDAQSYGLPVAPETLERVLRNDASEGMRAAALNALATNPAMDPERMQAWLEWAARDPSPLVREQAAALLGALNPPTDLPEEPVPDDSPLQTPDDAPPDIPAGDGSGDAENPAQ